jgi:hypothetical protein
MSPAYPDPGSVRKISVDPMCTVHEPYSPEGVSFLATNLDSKGFQRVEGVWHQTLPTTFIYGRFERLNHHAIDTFLTQSDCCSQAGRTTANNDNVCKVCSCLLTHRLVPNVIKTSPL